MRWKRSSRAIKSPRCRGAELVASASSLGSVALEPCSHAGGGFRSSGARGLRSSAHPTVHRLAQEGVSANSAAHLDIRRTFGWRSPFCWLCAQEGRFELQAFVSCYTSPDSEHRPGEQRAPERFEAEPNTGEQFPPARMLLFGPEQCPKLVPNSAKASSSGTEGSNLSRSANESCFLRILRPKRRNSPRLRRHLRDVRHRRKALSGVSCARRGQSLCLQVRRFHPHPTHDRIDSPACSRMVRKRSNLRGTMRFPRLVLARSKEERDRSVRPRPRR